MKSFDEATKIIHENISELSTTDVPIEKSLHYIVGEDIVSRVDVCPYRNSAMDGFAVAYDDIIEIPTTLPIDGVCYAGDKKIYDYKKGFALKIMTGAPVPEGYDTVIRVEDTIFDNQTVTLNFPIKKLQNIRMPGEDISDGDIILLKRERITALHIGILASLGLQKVKVIRKPNILILSTGNELVKPGEKLGFGQQYNSNSYTLLSMLSQFYHSAHIDSIVLDEPDEVEKALTQEYDMIISSGGVSAGDKDYIPKIAQQCGWHEMLYKAAIKPGKPIFFAIKENQYLFGLPGNPLSTAVTAACFVIPALKKMIGVKDYKLQCRSATLSKDSVMKSGRTLIWPGRIKLVNGNLIAKFSPKKSSAALSALLHTEGLIIQTGQENKSPRIEIVYWDKILNM